MLFYYAIIARIAALWLLYYKKKKNGGQDNTAPRRCQFSRAFYLFTEYSLERKFNMLNRYLNLKWEFLQIST